jgi:hypothetical protein
MSQMVHVVSILEVMMRLGLTVFQSSDVSGAVWSGVLELDKRASGVSLVTGASRPFLDVIDDPGVCGCVSDGSDHRRRWSPEVASKSVDCFCDDGGSQSKRVTGYEWVASATLVKSILHFDPPGT